MRTINVGDVISQGARSGTVCSADDLLQVKLGNPRIPCLQSRGPHPEHLFAGAYAACFHGAVLQAAERLKLYPGDSRIRVRVHLLEDSLEAWHLRVEIEGILPDLSPADTLRVLQEAHQTCPYSRALRGEATVDLVAS